MQIEIKVPVLPESVADASIATWHKNVGDLVTEGDILLDLETDKVVLEVPAPSTGRLVEIQHEAGAIVTAEQVIALIDTTAVASAPEKTEVASASEKQTDETAVSNNLGLSPAARRAATVCGVDTATLAQTTGTGKSGRLTKADVEALAHTKSTTSTQQAASVEATAAAPQSARYEERVPMSRLRARIAERLLAVQQSAAILTTFNEVNMQPVMQLRSQYKDLFEKKHGVRLGFMSFFVKAVTAALQQFPSVNASIDGQDIIYHAYQDIGIAVSSPRGLVVPILRNAEKLSMSEIEGQINQFGQKAKAGQLTLEEMTGGTFTLSNGGVFGSLLSTPIINPPQSAILGMHSIQERPVVEQGQIVIRPMMYLALSYDHRIIDGKESVSFLVTIKQFLESPARLLLDV